MWPENTRNAKIKGGSNRSVYGYETIDSNIYLFFEIKESKITRGHNFTLVKKKVDWMLGRNVWNKLSEECVHASSVNMFKNRINMYLVKAGYT